MKIGYLFAAAFVISLGIAIFGQAGLLSAFRLSQENARFEQRIQKLERDNEMLRQEIELVQKDPSHLEHTIRKSLSLVAPDEMLFDFQKSKD